MHRLRPGRLARHRPERHRPLDRRADGAGGDADRQSPGPLRQLQGQRPDPRLRRQQRRLHAVRHLRGDGGGDTRRRGGRHADRRPGQPRAVRRAAERRGGDEGRRAGAGRRHQDPDPGQGRHLRRGDDAQRHRRHAVRQLAAGDRQAGADRPVAGLQPLAARRPDRPAGADHRHLRALQGRLREPGQVRHRQQHRAGLRRGQDQRHHRRRRDRRLVAVLQCHAGRALQRPAHRRRRQRPGSSPTASTRPPAATRSSATRSRRSCRRSAGSEPRNEATPHEIHFITRLRRALALGCGVAQADDNVFASASRATTRTRRPTASAASACRPAPTPRSATRPR